MWESLPPVVVSGIAGCENRIIAGFMKMKGKMESRTPKTVEVVFIKRTANTSQGYSNRNKGTSDAFRTGLVLIHGLYLLFV